MKNITIARRYAKALFELAQETNSVDDVMLAMNNIALGIKSNPSFYKILKNPLVKPYEKESLVKTITSNKHVLKLIGILAKRGRMDLLEVLLEELNHLSDETKGIHRVLVKTASSLSELEKKIVEESLAKSLGGMVMGKFEVAKELIGGVWIKMGDKVFDASLKGRIDDLRYMLTHSTN